MKHTLAPFALALLALGALPATAQGAGFYITDRGVRPMGRAGAYVAGADDQHAIWYNPAGLAYADNGLLIDASLVFFGNSFTRQTRVTYNDASSGVVSFPTVQASAAPLPLPTLAFTHNFGLSRWRFAAAVFAPNAVITSYPTDALAPQRYSLYSLNGSLLLMGGLYASYRPLDNLSFGLGLMALGGSFSARMALSACPATITCQPENPDWDALAQLSVGPIFAPSATAGVRWSPIRYLVLGVSGQLPFWVNAPAQLDVRLPSSAFYNGSMVQGNQANVSFMLAPIVRAGVEVRPDAYDRIELAFVWEGWQVHDKIGLTPAGDGIRIVNARGLGTYEVGPVSINRNFQGAYSVRLGAERLQPLPGGWVISPRVGVAYETSATSNANTSVLTPDTNKLLLTIGLGFGGRRWRIDASFAYAVANTVNVSIDAASLYQVAPLRANDSASRDPINAGRYDYFVAVAGLGFRYSF